MWRCHARCCRFCRFGIWFLSSNFIKRQGKLKYAQWEHIGIRIGFLWRMKGWKIWPVGLLQQHMINFELGQRGRCAESASSNQGCPGFSPSVLVLVMWRGEVQTLLIFIDPLPWDINQAFNASFLKLQIAFYFFIWNTNKSEQILSSSRYLSYLKATKNEEKKVEKSRSAAVCRWYTEHLYYAQMLAFIITAFITRATFRCQVREVVGVGEPYRGFFHLHLRICWFGCRRELIFLLDWSVPWLALASIVRCVNLHPSGHFPADLCAICDSQVLMKQSYCEVLTASTSS